jgi:hypothetical protein
VPVLEMSYPGSSAYPTSVLVFERGQCTLETFARQRPSYFQQVTVILMLLYNSGMTLSMPRHLSNLTSNDRLADVCTF